MRKTHYGKCNSWPCEWADAGDYDDVVSRSQAHADLTGHTVIVDSYIDGED